MGKSRIYLENDHLKWQKNYEYEKDQILQAIGIKTLGIEHIRSISIKGMAARPIIYGRSPGFSRLLHVFVSTKFN